MKLGPMEFGAFHEFPRTDGTSDATGFDNGFELVDAAEQWGLHAIWLAELHISPRSVLASPIAIAAAIAARTERIKIGTAVQVLPLAHPLRQLAISLYTRLIQPQLNHRQIRSRRLQIIIQPQLRNLHFRPIQFIKRRPKMDEHQIALMPQQRKERRLPI